MKKNILTLVLFIFMNNVCWAQNDTIYEYLGHATLGNNLKTRTLVDKVTQTTFEIDSTQVFITAKDLNGKVLWRTDPWKDNNIREYRVKRPIIVRFDFANNNWTNNKEVIWIVYNNTQFGIIEKDTGKYTWFGQD